MSLDHTRRRKKSGKKLKRGRKKGSKNKKKVENVTPSYRILKTLLSGLWKVFGEFLPELTIKYMVGDSAYGTKDYIKLAESYGMCLISRLCDKPALYFLYDGPQKRLGKNRVYGGRCNFDQLDNKQLKDIEKTEDYDYYTFQFQALSKSIRGIVLNVVVIKVVRKKDGAVSYKVFFSNCLDFLRPASS